MHAFRLVGPVQEPSQGDEIPFAKMSCVPGHPSHAYGAKLCQPSKQWTYGSLYHWTQRTLAGRTRLSAWPIRRRSDWADHVAMAFSPAERQQLDWSARWGVPFGDET